MQDEIATKRVRIGDLLAEVRSVQIDSETTASKTKAYEVRD